MKINHTRVFNFEGAFRGMRNPKSSWHLSDSQFGLEDVGWVDQNITEVAAAWANKDNSSLQDHYDYLAENGIIHSQNDIVEYALLGPKDMELAKTLIKGGTEHRKFLRQIFVSVDLEAPLYVWKEADTYKVGTTANSTSTMHTIQKNPITIENFEIGDYDDDLIAERIIKIIDTLELLRQKYIITNKKAYWKELIRWLPESWLQLRTLTLNYEILRNIYHQRKNHKLIEWRIICKWIESLPYAWDLICS